MRNDQAIWPQTPKKREEKPIVKKKEKEPKEKDAKEAKDAKEDATEAKEGPEKEAKDKEASEAKDKEAAEAKDKEAAEPKDKEAGQAKDKEAKEKAPEEEVEAPEEPDYPSLQERLTINNSRKGESFIIITDSVRTDYGVFSVRVENDHGICTATCEVNVLGKTLFHSILFSGYLLGHIGRHT